RDSPPSARRPVSVRSVQRVHHVSDRNVEEDERDDTVVSVEYLDGRGRLLQTRTQAEDVTFGDALFGDGVLPAGQSAPPHPVVGRRRRTGGPNVVVSGWQVYDNKGRVVQKFEPFFAQGFAFARPGDAE